jgi:hypothetical protein
MTRPPLLIGLLAIGLLLAACADDDDATTHQGGSQATGSSEAAPDPESTEGSGSDTTPPAVVDPYDGHTSEVYDRDESWICRPDLADDECRDLDVTTVAPDGTTTVEERRPAENPPIDCFYVYPTVSSDPGPVADLEWAPEDNEARTVVAQAAQYARSCRVFAPVYRQITLNGLGSASQEQRATAYADVVDAWKTYISRWNEGRGVIVIGHSQGTGHLVRLLEDEVDGVPEVRERLVAAHLFGGSVMVPEGEVVGGTFMEIPACTSADETGCVITWSSYPAAVPPDDGGIFGRADEEGGRALCVDPTELLGVETSRPVAPVEAPLVGAVPGAEDVDTTFFAMPEALSLSCEATADHDYLAVAVADPADTRPVEGFVSETLGHSWGLHLVDMTVALDDLVELAERQGQAHLE